MDEIIDKLSKFSLENSENDEETRDKIKNYAKVVFDVTWALEKTLTDEEFKTESSLSRCQLIFDLLQHVIEICNGVNGKSETNTQNDYDSLINIMGIDYAECLLWRQGALRYSICHCKFTDSQWLRDDDNQNKFLRICLDGILILKSFLRLRKCDLNESDEANQESFYLISNGIFSDNHLLGAMYCGELCYWYDECSNKWSKHLFEESSVNLRELAVDVLNVYVNSVKKSGFEQAGTWNCENALKILKHFQDVNS